jgi:putative two-component system response regulator
MAAPMHDIGKIGIPDAILRKPGKLNQQEFEIMKTHSLIGARMLSGSDSPVLQMAEQIAYAHHEHWDGGGYPLGLVGNQIPACARLVAVVDVYDALTHARVYRPAMSEEDALAMIEAGRGTHFDPRCVSTFMEILPLIRQISSDNSDEASEQSGADHQKCLPVPHAPSTRGEGQSSLAHARRESVHCGHRSLIAGSSF